MAMKEAVCTSETSVYFSENEYTALYLRRLSVIFTFAAVRT
jgi:hypothetical protein